MSDAYIYEAVRTPRGLGTQAGSLYSVKPVSLLTGLMQELQSRYQIDTGLIDDVLLGCATPVHDQGANLGRIAVLAAGWAGHAAGAQLNRFCGSGLDAVNLAAQKVRSGWDDLVLAGGVESMSRVPAGTDGGAWMHDPETSLRTGYLPAGIAADLIATLDGCRREQLDAYALHSQQKASAARQAGRGRSMVPVRDQNGVLILDDDECMQPATTMDTLENLPPAFAELGQRGYDSIALRSSPQLRQLQHLHSAGNTAPTADGAALALIGSKAAGARLGMLPRARILAGAAVGADPVLMPSGAVAASHKALRAAGLTINDVDLFEFHEAYAAVALRFVREMAIPEAKLNVNGGAIAYGHPAGASGCMLLATLLDELEARHQRRGLIVMCAGAGIGVATLVERV